jgi:hypothetical protein
MKGYSRSPHLDRTADVIHLSIPCNPPKISFDQKLDRSFLPERMVISDNIGKAAIVRSSMQN